ncbi:DUF2958 domain-containing protein [bacterium]|nr:DUF2958 domain-containing protein [bacterium]
MSIIHKSFIRLFKEYPLYSQEHVKDPLVIIKLFDVAGSANWYLTEFDPCTLTAFGYVTGLGFDEWGYIYIPELEEIKHLEIPRIERDINFKPKPISQVLKKGGNNG